jgi:hypothetical protein
MEANMKSPEICLAILVILAACFLDACSSGGSVKCSAGGEVCIGMSTAPAFSMGSPVSLRITVTSSKDIPDLHVTLAKPAEVIMDGPQSWENYLSTSSNDPLFAYWNFAIKAGQTLTFDRVLHFPSHEGLFDIVAEAVNSGRIIEAVDSFSVQITNNGGHIIRAGTPFLPYTPNVTMAIYGPGTPFPKFMIATNTPTPIRFASLVATSTHLTLPYPPPPSITPSSSSATPPPYP